MNTLPSLIFDSNGDVFTETGVRAQIKAECTNFDLTERFIHSLKSGDKASFRRFCLRDFSTENDSTNYIIYPLMNRKWIPFRFAFCEKIRLEGNPVTAVFLSNHMSEFHSLMSPASPICRVTSDKLISDILSLRHARQNTVITPETLFLLREFPLIEKSAGGLSEEDSQCDLLLLTQMIFSQLAEEAHFGNLRLELELIRTDMAFGRPENQIIVPCPVEAYVYLTVLIGYIFGTLSDDRIIRGTVRYLGPGAEISLGIETSGTCLLNNGCSNLEDLFPPSHNLASLARAASCIAHTFDLFTDLSVNAETGLLTAHIGVGMEKFVPAGFRYSDPYGKINAILKEALRLIA
ncbi:MAG: hypothetical protein IJ334_19285 [Clostridia bacterium]|nr:hypothetical protein [Clostridia bacterium]